MSCRRIELPPLFVEADEVVFVEDVMFFGNGCLVVVQDDGNEGVREENVGAEEEGEQKCRCQVLKRKVKEIFLRF